MSLILDIIYPRSCFGCGRAGFYLCPPCRREIVLKGMKKGDRLSLFRYHGAIKKLITALKFDFVTDVIPEITDFMSQSIISKYPNLLDYWQSKSYVLTPIPLHPSRYNWRGFNQSELICHELSKNLKLNYDPKIISRTKNTQAQTSFKDKLLRKNNIADSFSMIDDKYQNIILFDDVYTTGSTITSAKSVFPKKSQIWTLTIAG